MVILNHNGGAVLPTCIESALGMHGLASPAAVVVADNGSTDGSTEDARRAFPGITILHWEDNLGFAGGNNRAAEALDSEFILFANNDTCLAPDVLRQLADAVGGDVACSGARLVDWSGRRLDFDGGGAALTGHGHALRFGQPVTVPSTTPRPTLFASGAAMFVHRPTFLRLGGFDADYFCYYEDVDLGWRLWLAGYRVLHVASAVVRHHHGATARHVLGGRSQILCERNALSTVVKNCSADRLERLLPAALSLAAVRGGAPRSVIAEAGERSAGAMVAPDERMAGGTPWLSEAAPSDGCARRAGEPEATNLDRSPQLPLPSACWSGWPYLAPLELDWPALVDRRACVQALRRRRDEVIVPLFAHPFAPVPPDSGGWWALVAAVERFALESDFGPLPRRGKAIAWLQRIGRRGVRRR